MRLEEADVRSAALGVSVATFLIPPLANAVRLVLRRSSAEDICIGVCLNVFAVTLCLWLLDACGVMPLTRSWMSTAIWTAAISSILPVGVSFFSKLKTRASSPPYQGKWQAMIEYESLHKREGYIAEGEAMMVRTEKGYDAVMYVEIHQPNDDHVAIRNYVTGSFLSDKDGTVLEGTEMVLQHTNRWACEGGKKCSSSPPCQPMPEPSAKAYVYRITKTGEKVSPDGSQVQVFKAYFESPDGKGGVNSKGTVSFKRVL